MTLGINLALPNNSVLTAPDPATATSTLAGMRAAIINQPLEQRFASAILLACGDLLNLAIDPTAPNPDTKVVELARRLIRDTTSLNNMAKNAIVSALSQGYIIANNDNTTNGVFDDSSVPDTLILAFLSGMINAQTILLEIA